MKRNPRPATSATDEQTIVYPPVPAYASVPPKAASRVPATKPTRTDQSRETGVPPSSLFARYDEPSPNPTPKPTSQVMRTRSEPTRMPATYLSTEGWPFNESQQAANDPATTFQVNDPPSCLHYFPESPNPPNQPPNEFHVMKSVEYSKTPAVAHDAPWSTGDYVIDLNTYRDIPLATPGAQRVREHKSSGHRPTPDPVPFTPCLKVPFPTKANSEVPMNETPDDRVVALLEHLVQRTEQMEKRQDALADAFSQQNQVIASLVRQTQPELPTSRALAALPPNIPGSSIQPAAPAYPAPMLGGMYPTAYPQPGQGMPYERREIRRVVVNYPNGTKKTLTEAESLITLDPRTGTETSEVTQHRYTNRGGELLDHNEQLWTCCDCGDFTNNPLRCRVCGRPLCQQHAWVNTYEVTDDGSPQYRCRACIPPERGFWQQFFCGR